MNNTLKFVSYFIDCLMFLPGARVLAIQVFSSKDSISARWAEEVRHWDCILERKWKAKILIIYNYNICSVYVKVYISDGKFYKCSKAIFKSWSTYENKRFLLQNL